MKRKALITAAIVFMAGGLWWQFVGSANGSANQEPTEPADTTTATTDTAASSDITEPDDYYDQDNPTGPTAETDDGEEQKNLATDEDLDRCVASDGFGIVMKDWGKIRLPYSDTWPKNEPGTPIDCAPFTDFGGAVAAAHALFLESMSPELIPEIALDTPARQQRIDRHSGKYDPAELTGTCTLLGWDKPQQGISIWLIFYQCGDGPIEVSTVRMQHDTGQWLMVYNIDGRVIINEAEPDTTYFPFEGGD